MAPMKKHEKQQNRIRDRPSRATEFDNMEDHLLNVLLITHMHDSKYTSADKTYNL